LRYRKALLVFRKDWREISRNWQILFPVLFVPFMFSIVLPLIVVLMPGLATVPGSSLNNTEAIIANLPTQVKEELEGMTAQQVLLSVMTLYYFAPFFLIIPVMASSVIASDSFAGEKERKTIEALLATPITDSELLLGKVLVSFIPSIAVTLISFLVYSTVVDIVSVILLHGKILLPNIVWIMLILGLAPTIALVGIGLTVIVSARVKGFKEAQQISGLLLIPILMLVFGQMAGVVVFGSVVVAGLIGLLAIVDLVVFRMGVRLFRREEILSRLA